MLFAMRNTNQPAAIVAWRGHNLCGYALNVYGLWSCAAFRTSGGARQICYTTEDALAWLRQATSGVRFEPVADRDELDALIAELPPEHVSVLTTAQLFTATYANGSAFAPFT